jgi:hypothetical protein
MGKNFMAIGGIAVIAALGAGTTTLPNNQAVVRAVSGSGVSYRLGVNTTAAQ